MTPRQNGFSNSGGPTPVKPWVAGTGPAATPVYSANRLPGHCKLTSSRARNEPTVGHMGLDATLGGHRHRRGRGALRRPSSSLTSAPRCVYYPLTMPGVCPGGRPTTRHADSSRCRAPGSQCLSGFARRPRGPAAASGEDPSEVIQVNRTRRAPRLPPRT
jgi:hypothetical protein